MKKISNLIPLLCLAICFLTSCQMYTYKVTVGQKEYYTDSYSFDSDSCIVIPPDSCGCGDSITPAITICDDAEIWDRVHDSKINIKHSNRVPLDNSSTTTDYKSDDDSEVEFVDTTDYSIEE